MSAILPWMKQKNYRQKVGKRILTNNQIKGRGRRSSIWKSNNKDIVGTWNIRKSILKKMEPGILQIIVGVRIANVLEFNSVNGLTIY